MQIHTGGMEIKPEEDHHAPATELTTAASTSTGVEWGVE
jgi:hypothetical protein